MCFLRVYATILKDTYAPVFTVTLFTVARTWKRPKCPLTDKWIKMWYKYRMEYYSAIKGNKFESAVGRWMNLVLYSVKKVKQKKKIM